MIIGFFKKKIKKSQFTKLIKILKMKKIKIKFLTAKGRRFIHVKNMEDARKGIVKSEQDEKVLDVQNHIDSFAFHTEQAAKLLDKLFS